MPPSLWLITLLSLYRRIAFLYPFRHSFSKPEKVLVACILKKNDGAG